MATWLEEHGVELVVLAGLHAPADRSRSSTASRAGSSTSTLAAAARSRARTRSRTRSPPDVETTGVTVHYVDEGLDTGAVILGRRRSPVEPRETLEERIHAVEHRLLSRGGERQLCLVR